MYYKICRLLVLSVACCSESHFCDQTQRKATSHTPTRSWKQWGVWGGRWWGTSWLKKLSEMYRVTQDPQPKGCPQKGTHLISITQRWQPWQQLATLLLHLPSHYFVFLGQTRDSFFQSFHQVTQAGGTWIRRWHNHIFLYIMPSEDPALGISIT